MTTSPGTVEAYVDPMTHTDMVGESMRVRTGHLDIWFRFPATMPAADRGAFLAQLAAVATTEEARYLAADEALVPTQRRAES